jgi:hypothetical protein
MEIACDCSTDTRGLAMTRQSRHRTRQPVGRIGSTLALLSVLAGCAGEPVCDAGEGAAVGAVAPLAAGASTGDAGALLLGVLLVPVGAAVGALVGALSECPAVEDQPQPAPTAEQERQCTAAVASTRRLNCDEGLGTACRAALVRANEQCASARPSLVDENGAAP